MAVLLDVVSDARLDVMKSNGLRDVGAGVGAEVGVARVARVLVSMYAIACSIAHAHSRTSLSLSQQNGDTYEHERNEHEKD